MKKVLITILALVLTCTLAFSVFAAGELGVTLDAKSTTLKRGESVVVSVSIADFADCKSGSLRITYDKDQFTRSDNDWLLDNTMMATADGDAVFVLDGIQNLSGSIYRFTLTVKDTAPIKDSTVKISLTLKNKGGTSTTEVKELKISLTCDHSFGEWKAADKENHSRVCSLCGNVQTEKHTWDAGKVTTASGCSQTGEMTHTCTTCGATKTEKIPAGDHVWDGGEVTREPTCSEPGARILTCASCGTTKTEEIPATGEHDYGEWKKVDGSTHTRECKDCRKTDTKDHRWNDGKVIKEATCVEAGEKTFTCKDCGATRTETLEKLSSHTYDNACDSTCKYCDETRTPPHQYSEKWSSDGSGHWHECSGCGLRKDEADHVPGAAATESKPQTCTTCDYVLQSALGHTHNYSTTRTHDEEGHWYACSGCDEKKDYAQHYFVNSCETTCALCGYERETEHDYSDRLSFDATGHWNACSGCGDILEKQPHRPGPQATETTDQVCLDCGFVLQYASSHSHAPSGDLLANSTEHWYQCSCGERINVNLHTWDEGVADVDAGVMKYMCTICGFSRGELLPDDYDPNQTEPTDPAESKPGQNVQQGGAEKPNQQEPMAWWWYIVIAACVLLLGAVIFVIIGILVSRKQTGKFAS